MKKNTVIKTGLIVSSLAVLSACAAPMQTTLLDGTTATRIECDGTARGLNFCFELAGKSCGAEGYTILNKAGETIGKSDVAGVGSDQLVRKQAEDENGLLIRCGT